jgi:hypothetical protein
MRRPHPSIRYLHGDVSDVIPEGNFDVVVLSNVLEHLESRVTFLGVLQKTTRAGRYLIRVPLYERDWRVPLKAELGVDYRLDPTHRIEYTYKGVVRELAKAGLKINEMEVRWGELWAEAVPNGLG